MKQIMLVKTWIVQILVHLPALIITGCSVYLSSQSVLRIPMHAFWNADKVIHLFSFAGLAGSWTLWFPPKSWKANPVRNALICIIGVAVYGALDEFHQSFTPGREVSVFDWMADVAGAVLGTGAGAFLWRRLK
ncbi:MAG: VanZ family protein [Treponema sp.]|jgi:VanZ family protein|nr:VanZ family protein [Treponema sp.]